MDRTTKMKGSDRRNFLVGLLTSAGVAAVALGAMGGGGKKALKREEQGTDQAEPVLYRRTAESERYYKTLYT